MRLSDWRRKKGWTQQRLADELGCTLTTVARYEAEMRQPERSVMKGIYVLTDGLVQPNDFYDLPAWEAERIRAEGDAELAARRAA